MASTKKKSRIEKRKKNFISRPLLCKIEIIEHGNRVMEYKGDMEMGFDRFRAIVEDVFQVKDKVKQDERKRK